MVISFYVRISIMKVWEIDKDEVNYFKVANNTSYINLFLNNYWTKDDPGLYMIIEKAVISISSNIFHLRLINFVASILTGLFLYKMSYLFFSKSNKYLLPALIMGSYLFIFLSIYARDYQLAACFLIISNYFYLKIHFSKYNVSDIVFFSIFLTFAAYTSYTTIFYIISILIFDFYCLIRKKLNIKVSFFSFGLAGLLSLPQFIIALKNIINISGVAPPVKVSIFNMIDYVASGTFFFLAQLPDYCVDLFLLIIFLIIIYLFRNLKNTKIKSILILSIIFIFVPFISMYILRKFLHYHLTTDLFFLSSMGIFIILTIFFTHKKSLFIKLFLAIYYLTILFSLSNNNIFYKKYFTSNKYLTRIMENSCSENSLYIVNSSFYDYFPIIDYYLWDYDLPKNQRNIEKSLCVANNLIIFDTITGLQDNTNNNLKNKDKIYFIYLTNSIADKRFYNYLQLCKKKTCFSIKLPFHK